MKLIPHLKGLRACLGVLALSTSSQAAPPPTLERTSQAELEERLRHSGPVFGDVAAAPGVPEAVVSSAPAGLLERSLLIGDGECWTLVPKEALLHAPERLQIRILAKPAGRAVEWREFLGRNRGWLATQEVSMAQARGDEALPVQVQQLLASSGRMVIAVHQSGPISVKPLRTGVAATPQP